MNTFIVRLDDAEHTISAPGLTALEAAEIVAWQCWPHLRGQLDNISLVERAGDWRIYKLTFGDDSARVAVCKKER